MSSSVQAILFDAYGTLFDVASVREVVAELRPDASAFVAACWVNRSAAAPERLGFEPHQTIRTLVELPELLRALIEKNT